jgi:hypothetical protein
MGGDAAWLRLSVPVVRAATSRMSQAQELRRFQFIARGLQGPRGLQGLGRVVHYPARQLTR